MVFTHEIFFHYNFHRSQITKLAFNLQHIYDYKMVIKRCDYLDFSLKSYKIYAMANEMTHRGLRPYSESQKAMYDTFTISVTQNQK